MKQELNRTQLTIQIKEATAKVGYDLLGFRFLTNNPQDYYLHVVIAKSDKGFAVWLYNSNDQGLSEGFYTDNFDLALKKYDTKR